MRNLGRILTLGVLGLAGCGELTFPLLPEDGGAPMAGGAGAGAGAGAEAGLGATAGVGAAGMPGRGGTGGRGASGAAGMAQGGMGNGSGCPPPGCDPPHCSIPNCIPCASEADCQQKGSTKLHCNLYTNSCVECRYTGDCKDEGRASTRWPIRGWRDSSLGRSTCLNCCVASTNKPGTAAVVATTRPKV